jgi:hypothetical protein
MHKWLEELTKERRTIEEWRRPRKIFLVGRSRRKKHETSVILSRVQRQFVMNL